MKKALFIANCVMCIALFLLSFANYYYIKGYYAEKMNSYGFKIALVYFVLLIISALLAAFSIRDMVSQSLFPEKISLLRIFLALIPAVLCNLYWLSDIGYFGRKIFSPMCSLLLIAITCVCFLINRLAKKELAQKGKEGEESV